jgi:outer membrane immunogenic protein
MNRLLLSALVGAVGIGLALPAFAADLPRPAYKAPIYTAPTPAFSWSGFYVGINGGYGFGKADLSNVFGTGSVTMKGALVGGTLGYNMQSANWVWGLEGDIDYSAVKGTDSTAGTLCAVTGCEGKTTWLGTARGRIGYAFDRWLPYLTGGIAFGNFTVGPTGGPSQTKTQVGWTIGAGLEYAFLGPWSAKIEYLYADLGKATCDIATCGVSTDVRFRENLVRVGLNYRY